MGCKELDLTSYFRLTPTTDNPKTCIGDSAGTSETANSRFKPVVSVSITNYRYYSPTLGRWLSRDPIQERGGFNLYGMVGNNAVDFWDYLGQASFEDLDPALRRAIIHIFDMAYLKCFENTDPCKIRCCVVGVAEAMRDWFAAQGFSDNKGFWDIIPDISGGMTGELSLIDPTGVIGEKAGINKQWFSDGSSSQYTYLGDGFGLDLGGTFTGNFAIGNGGEDSWTGDFENVTIGFGIWTADIFWSDSWVGLSFGVGAAVPISAAYSETDYKKDWEAFK